MQIVEVELSLTVNGSFKLYALGDFHVGSAGFDEDRLRKDVQVIRDDKSAYWVGVGDYADSIVIQDAKRFDHKSIDERFTPFLDDMPQQQCKLIIEILKPIAHKCWGIVSGNHEDKIRKFHSFDMMEYIANGLCVENLMDVAVIMLKVEFSGGKRRLYKIYVAHGTMVGNSVKTKMRKIMSDISADIFLFGHGHQRVHEPRVSLDVVKKDIKWDFKDKQQVSVMTGSYLKLYVQGKRGYGERAAFSPNKMGCVFVEVFPRASESKFSEEYVVHV